MNAKLETQVQEQAKCLKKLHSLSKAVAKVEVLAVCEIEQWKQRLESLKAQLVALSIREEEAKNNYEITKQILAQTLKTKLDYESVIQQALRHHDIGEKVK